MAHFGYNHHDIYYNEFGFGEPLLLLHGNTASSVMFDEIAAEYAKDRRVIVMDFLGCGKSDRVESLADDLWYDEAAQAVTLLDEKGYTAVDVIGTSGGAQAAINIALERPNLVNRLIADSFEGEKAMPGTAAMLAAQREASKKDAGAKMFYQMMNGEDWKTVIDADTRAVCAHAKHIGSFFHKPVSELEPEILFTGSREDAFFPEGFYDSLFDGLITKIGHGSRHVFEHGGHPAMLTNQDEFLTLSREFFDAK